ncbi:MAG: hypothetical protein CMH12_09240 [Maritimibacter sp.]|nr:hypothetical protein [Maritimibacter sp.]
MKTRIAAVLLALACAAPADAQNVVDGALSDLNGDGLRERFTLLHYPGADTADLIIEDTGTGRITAHDFVQSPDVPGRIASVDVAPNGSIRVHSLNESIGRGRWRQTLTIAFRDGAYRVAGLTYEYYDTLDLAAFGGCDLNFLNGKGFAWHGTRTRTAMTHDNAAVPMVDWSDSTPLPAVCIAP